MADSTFGEVDFEQMEVDEDGRGKFTRVDPTPYIKFIEQLNSRPAGTEARISVVTGEIITKGKASKGRGKSELSDVRAFQQAASSIDKGLRVGWRHLPDGMTQLRLMLQPKRVFSPETEQKRTAALEKRRLQIAEDKLKADPTNSDLQAKVDAIRARMNGATVAPKTTKAKVPTS